MDFELSRAARDIYVHAEGVAVSLDEILQKRGINLDDPSESAKEDPPFQMWVLAQAVVDLAHLVEEIAQHIERPT
jgi:hypothetical protein